MYHDHIIQHWKPDVLTRLDALHQQVTAQITALGTPVSELTTQKVLQAVQHQVGCSHSDMMMPLHIVSCYRGNHANQQCPTLTFHT